MKIEFSQEEYRSLVDLLSLAGCMLEGYGRGADPRKADCFKVEQKLLSYAEDAGCRDLVKRDPEDGTYLRKWANDSKESAVAWLYEYHDDLFWEELIIRMAERDFHSFKAVEVGGKEPIPEQQKPVRLMELEKHYEDEFVADGLDNLVLRNKAAEGIN
ncbi:MAG: hypothetical protein VB980_03090 [Opitutales bacterium]|jgi:hypothetical protein